MSTKKYVVQHKNKKKERKNKENEHKDTPYLYIRARSTKKKEKKGARLFPGRRRIYSQAEELKRKEGKTCAGYILRGRKGVLRGTNALNEIIVLNNSSKIWLDKKKHLPLHPQMKRCHSSVGRAKD